MTQWSSHKKQLFPLDCYHFEYTIRFNRPYSLKKSKSPQKKTIMLTILTQYF